MSEPTDTLARVSRRAGSRWRLLVHVLPFRSEQMYGRAHHVSSYPMRRYPELDARLPEDLRSQHEVIPETDFDELVVGRWLHVEGMDTNFYWMNVGGVTLHVKADSEGRPTLVTVHMPGTYDEAVDGCKYRLNDEEWADGRDTR